MGDWHWAHGKGFTFASTATTEGGDGCSSRHGANKNAAILYADRIFVLLISPTMILLHSTPLLSSYRSQRLQFPRDGFLPGQSQYRYRQLVHGSYAPRF